MTNAIVIYRNGENEHAWCKWMVARTMKKNKNNLVSVIGKTGSGKTYSAIAISEIMSKMDGVPFTIDHVVFTLKELMDLINSGVLKRGSKIVCDEFQCSIGARDFQSKANKIFNYLLTTFRHLNLTLFFCTPFETLLDKSTRKLFHAKFETVSINANKKTCKLKPRYIEYNDFKTQPYSKRLIIFSNNKVGDGKKTKLSYWDVPIPSEEILKQYEKKKKEFTTRLNKNISSHIEEFEGTGITSDKKKKERKELSKQQKLVINTLAKVGNCNFKEAAKITGLAQNSIKRYRTDVHNKGWSIKDCPVL